MASYINLRLVLRRHWWYQVVSRLGCIMVLAMPAYLLIVLYAEGRASDGVQINVGILTALTAVAVHVPVWPVGDRLFGIACGHGRRGYGAVLQNDVAHMLRGFLADYSKVDPSNNVLGLEFEYVKVEKWKIDYRHWTSQLEGNLSVRTVQKVPVQINAVYVEQIRLPVRLYVSNRKRPTWSFSGRTLAKYETLAEPLLQLMQGRSLMREVEEHFDEQNAPPSE